MEGDSKRRSGSYESEKTFTSQDTKKLSLSEGSNLDKESSPTSNISPGSSEQGTLKKPKKFRPKKFLAKRFSRKKSEKSGDEQETSTENADAKSSSSKLSEKLSPKLKKFNFVKRFTGTRKYKVNPSADDGSNTNLQKLGGLSVSESSVKAVEDENEEEVMSEPSTELLSFEEGEKFISEVDIPFEESAPLSTSASVTRETVTLESKKVQLKITISGRKVEQRGSPSPSASDKASQPTHSPHEQTRDDIELLSTSQVRLNERRDQFFRSMLPAKPITEASDPTSFAAVVKEGLPVQAEPPEGASEVEKYSALTSSLNTIISEAKELDDSITTPTKGENSLKIREVPEVKLVDEPRVVDVTRKSFVLAQSTPKKAVAGDAEALDTSEIVEEDSDEMRKHKKSRIPVERRRLSQETPVTTSIRTQEAASPYHLNLSTPTSDESPSKGEIKFEIGNPVRPSRTSPATSTTALATLADLEPIQAVASEDSSIEEFHSPKSESLPTETSRRRIRYVPQLSTYTAEEQELLRSNIAANTLDSVDLNSAPNDSSMFPVFDDSLVRKFLLLCLRFCPRFGNEADY